MKENFFDKVSANYREEISSKIGKVLSKFWNGLDENGWVVNCNRGTKRLHT